MLMSVDGVPIGQLSPDQQMEKFAKLAAQIDGHVCWTNREVPVGYTTSDLISAGYSIVSYPIDALRVSIAAMRRLFASMMSSGTAVDYYNENPGDRLGAAELATSVLGLDGFMERETKFAWLPDTPTPSDERTPMPSSPRVMRRSSATGAVRPGTREDLAID